MIERAFVKYTDEELRNVYKEYKTCSDEGLVPEAFRKEAKVIKDSVEESFTYGGFIEMAKNQFFTEIAERFFKL